MKLRLKKSIVGVAYVAALTFSADAFSQANSNVKLLLEMQNLRQEIADLRNKVEVQGYMIDQLQKSSNKIALSQATKKQPVTSVLSSSTVLVEPSNPLGLDEKNTSAGLTNTLPEVNSSVSPELRGQQQRQVVSPSQSATVDRSPLLDFPVEPVQTVNTAKIKPNLGEISEIKTKERPANSPAPVTLNQAKESRLLAEGDKAIRTNLSEVDLYNKGISKLQAKEYKTAASIFSAQLQNHPKGQKAADSYYWLAEIFYILKDYDSSIKSYEALFTLFPKHSRAEKALYKLINLHIEQGDNISAKSTFGKLINLYPNSKSAKQAKALYKDFL